MYVCMYVCMYVFTLYVCCMYICMCVYVEYILTLEAARTGAAMHSLVPASVASPPQETPEAEGCTRTESGYPTVTSAARFFFFFFISFFFFFLFSFLFFFLFFSFPFPLRLRLRLCTFAFDLFLFACLLREIDASREQTSRTARCAREKKNPPHGLDTRTVLE